MGKVKQVFGNIPVVGQIVKGVSDVATKVLQPVEKAIVQPVSAGLASLDKTVGNAIPGGWGTVAQVAGSFAGLPTPMMVGLGALTGSGVMRPGRSFNLQGAVLGGAMAYAGSELASYARGASDSALQGAAQGASQTGGALAQTGSGAYIIPGELGDIAVNSQGQLLNASGQVLNPATQAATQAAATQAGSSGIASLQPAVANAPMYTAPQALQEQYIQQGLQEGYESAFRQPSMFESAKQAIVEAPSKAVDYVSNIPSKIGSGISSAYDSLANVADKATSYDTYAGAIDRGMTNVGDTASGIKNLVMGTPGASQTAAAAAKAAGTTSPLIATGVLAYTGMGLAALDEQRKYLEQAKAANAISQAEYNQAVADIENQRAYAESVVKANPFNPNPSRDVSIGETYYPRAETATQTMYPKSATGTLYAMGGSVDDELGGDYSAMGMDQGNLRKGLFGLGYAAGGTPRFLSGGGDGMSDSIPATINNKQPARLADGEFVIPADVVSHLGNGSSKAGAKQLYAMMDKVRTARTGRKAQGKQINPSKYMPA